MIEFGGFSQYGCRRAAAVALAIGLACVLPLGHAGSSLSTQGSSSSLPGLSTSGSCDPAMASCTKPTCSLTDSIAGKCKPGDPAPVDPAPGGPGGGTCSAPPGGNPTCGGGGPAAKDSSGPASGGGNPINLINGNKYQEETDLAALPGVLGLEFKRYYNSQSTHPGLLGANWRMSYETILYDFGSQIQIVQADGQRLMFQRGVGGNATLCGSAQIQDGQVRIEEPKDGKGQRVYHWRWPDGRTLMFTGGSGGGFPLQSITAASGQRVTLNYSPAGDLISIRDPQGRKLTFVYANAAEQRSRALKAIDTPLGRLSFTQDKLGRLTEVASSKDATSAPYQTKVYHYEDKYNAGHKTALTGISVRSTEPQIKKPVEQRLSTYAYNAAGQAILSTKGRPRELKDGKPVPDTGIEQIDVQYVEKSLPYEGKADKATGEVKPKQLGKTILTNSLGQKTEVFSAVIGGHYRLIEMRGAGCSTCGPSNMRYAYDANGNLVRATRLDGQGNPLTSQVTQYDGYGRVAKVGQQEFRVTSTKPTAQPVQWTWRYEYTDVRYKDGSVAIAPTPSVIVQPSVVAGKEHVLRMSYNELWQITSITEEGFSPLDDKGQPSLQGSPINRSTSYSYNTINGRSVLAAVDGPLKNGPKNSSQDSDITTFSYDERADYLVASTAPGNFITRLAYDQAGRIVKQSLMDGYRQIDTTTSYEGRATAATQAQLINRSAWRLNARGQLDPSSLQTLQVLQASLDALGRRIQSTGSDGLSQTLSYAGTHPATLTGAQGQQTSWVYDTEGHLLAQVNQDAKGQVTAGRMWLRDEKGRLRATLNPQGLERIFAYADEGVPGLKLPAIKNTANNPATDASGAQRPTLRDDFGRVVYERHSEDGTIVTVFESTAGAEVQTQIHTSTDGKLQNNETLVFDMAGRLQSRSRGEPGIDRCTETLHYQGQLLTQLQGCGSSQQFERDAFGQITVQTQLLESTKLQTTQRYEYDAQGQLISRTTPDGKVLRYHYNPATHKTQAVGLQRAWLSFLAKITGQSAATTLASRLPTGWSEKTLYDKALADSQSQVAAVAAPSVSTKPLQLKATQVSHDTYGRQTRHTPASGPNAGQTQMLVWNSLHQLVEVHGEPDAETAKAGALVASYQYDANGNRISKTVGGTATTASNTTHYLYDNAHRLLAETDASGKITRHYLYANHRLYGILEGGHVYAVQTDWRGLPTQVNDEHQRTVWAQKFDAWGNAESKATTAFNMPLRLAGQQYDPETGLHYNIHRYFDPAQGRYISPDPLGVPDGNDRYAYAKGNPMGGIDPLGLFEIPVGALNGNDFYFVDMKVEPGDHGHGDILREAFWQYQKSNPGRFSQSIIDQIIVNNYQTDAENKTDGCLPIVDGVKGGGQCVYTNHFDNPNAGAGAPYEVKEVIDSKTGKMTYVSTGKFRSTYTNTHWLQDAVDDVNKERSRYGDFEDNGADGADISQTLSSFGRNSHALADFYAHSNWVDGAERGGCWLKIPLVGANQRGWIPTGLNKQVVWDENVSSDLYSGTVGLTELKGSFDKSTHSYWNKDSDKTQTDETPYTLSEQGAFNDANMLYWSVEEYDPATFIDKNYKTGLVNGWESANGLGPTTGLKKGDLIYVALPIANRHRMATYLAVQHTILEIDKLWKAAAGKTLGRAGKAMQEVFNMSKAELSANGVAYQVLWPKDKRP